MDNIAKHMTTAVLLTSLFSRMDKRAWYLYCSVLLAVLLTLAAGLVLIDDKKEDK